MKTTVAFLGLGSMGTPMATNLLKGGLSLFVYNRSREKTQELTRAGALLLDKPSDAFRKAAVVITMVANDHALEELTTGREGILESIKPGDIHISMSTVSPATTHKLERLHRDRGASLVAAPVFGRPDAAAAAKLWIAIAGDAQAKAKVEPVLHLLGQCVQDFGTDPRLANVVKLTGNFLILSAIEGMGEACTLAEANGIDKSTLMTFFAETLFACPVYKNYGSLIAREAFSPAGFKLSLGVKDINLVRSTADSSSTHMPVANLLHELLQEGVQQGREDLDWAAITLSAKQGVQP